MTVVVMAELTKPNKKKLEYKKGRHKLLNIIKAIKNLNLLIMRHLIISILILSGICISPSCKKNNQVEVIEDERNDTVENLIALSDYGSGTSNFTAVYEKLIAPYNYKHFCQLNSSSFPTKACLPTSYMIAKGLIKNIQVNNTTLQPIITGMKTDNVGTSTNDAYSYAKSDLGNACTDLFLPTSNPAAFDKIYNSIKDGFPLLSLISIKRLNNNYLIEPNSLVIRHYVVIVGIRVQSFTNKTGEIHYIDPLESNATGQIKTEDLTVFINSTLAASKANPKNSNLIRIGCATDAITTNYFTSALILKNGPVVGFPNGAGSCAEFYPYGQSGTPPYQYSMNNSTWQSSNMFLICYTGQYNFRVKDATGTIAQLNRTF
jgi:hypothetical protein